MAVPLATEAEVAHGHESQGFNAQIRARGPMNKIATWFGSAGAGLFVILNLATKGLVPGGLQGGFLGFGIGYALARLVLAFIPSRKMTEEHFAQSGLASSPLSPPAKLLGTLLSGASSEAVEELSNADSRYTERFWNLLKALPLRDQEPAFRAIRTLPRQFSLSIERLAGAELKQADFKRKFNLGRIAASLVLVAIALCAAAVGEPWSLLPGVPGALILSETCGSLMQDIKRERIYRSLLA